MNAFLWDRDLRRHYLDGQHVQPAGQPHRLQDAGAGRREGAVVVAAHPRARVLPLPARSASPPTSPRGGRKLLKLNAWECLLAMMAEMERQVARADDRFEVARSNAELDAVLAARQDGDRPHRRGRPRPRRRARRGRPRGRLARLEELAERGVASLTLAHLFPNDLAGHAEAHPRGAAQVPHLPAGHRGGPVARADARRAARWSSGWWSCA